MNSLLISVFLFFGSTAVFATQNFEPSTLKSGQCYSDPFSKIYLSSYKNNKNQFSQLRNEYGDRYLDELVDSSDQEFFFCRLTCLNMLNKWDEYYVQLSDAENRHIDMNGFLCPGIIVEKVNLVGSIWVDQPVVYAVNAYESIFHEAHKWLKKSHFTLSAEEYTRLSKKMRDTFNSVGTSFFQSQDPALIALGLQFLEVAADTPKGRIILGDAMEQLNAQNWQLEQNFAGTNNIFLQFVKNQALFTQYYLPHHFEL